MGRSLPHPCQRIARNLRSNLPWLQAAEAWRSASEQAKAPNVAAANLEKQQYDKALDEYKITLQKAYQEAETAVEAAAVASHDAAVQPALYQVCFVIRG